MGRDPQLEALLVLTPKRYSLLVELIARIGLRISEAVALAWPGGVEQLVLLEEAHKTI